MLKRMRFIQPKNRRAEKVEWELSEQARNIVRYYAQYTEYTEEEVLEKFLLNLLDDEGFKEWIKNKRNNKRIIAQVFNDEELEEEDIV